MHLKQLEKMSSFNMLKRFLLYGGTDAMAAATLQFDEDSLNTIQSILEELEGNISEVITYIRDIHRFALKMRRYKMAIPFVLAILSKFPEHIHVAYKTASTLLQTFEEFVHFIKFTEQIPPLVNEEVLREAIQDWCEGIDAKSLAQMCARVKPECEGYSLKTILVMGNVFRSDDPKKGVVYECVHNGVESALEKYLHNNDAVAVTILDYLFNFSRLDDLESKEALPIIEEFEYRREQMTCKHLSSVCTWTRMLGYLVDLEDLNLCVEALCKVLFFRNIHFIDMLCCSLKNERTILRSKIHPSKSLIAEKKISDRIRQSEDLILLASKIEEGLKAQKEVAFKNIQKSEIDVTVIIDCHVLDETVCANNVKGSEAAAMLACSLTHLARNIQIITFDGYKQVPLNCEQFSETVDHIEALSGHKTSVKAVENYLKGETSSNINVFVGKNVKDYFDLITRENLLNRKYVFCNLNEENNINEALDQSDDILVISGFFESTCELVEAFANYI